MLQEDSQIRQIRGQQEKIDDLRMKLAFYDQKYSGIDIDELHKTNNLLKEKLDIQNWIIDQKKVDGGNPIFISEIMKNNDQLIVQEKRLKHINLESILSQTFVPKKKATVEDQPYNPEDFEIRTKVKRE